jgi:GntR family transcriptional regulator/MocR family aminotransferase
MPRRRTPTSRPDFVLDAGSPMPLYKQLYERLRAAILAGRLESGARLPSTRQLASELGISRSTTVLAYQLLALEGYLEGRVGRGTAVAREVPALLPPGPAGQAREQPRGERAGAQPSASARPRVATRVRPVQEAQSPAPWVGSPRGVNRAHDPAVDRFPYAVWARLLARRARQTLGQAAAYQPPAGYLPLREAIAAEVGITRGVRCTPEQVVITTGAQGALDLAARTLLDPGDAAWLEDPGYRGARAALLAAEAQLIPVPVDAQGLDVERGRRREPRARLASTTPSHQFPTGVTMSLGRRLALLEWARQADAWIVEDDYDCEFRWSGRPLEALQGLDTAGRVVYIGSFSKTLFPGLRLGYLIAPPALLEPLLFVRRAIDVHPPMLEQMALCDFLREGYYSRYLRSMRQVYRQRRDRLYDGLRAHLGDLLDVQAPEAGLRLVGWLPPGIDDRRAAELAARVGIEVDPLSIYGLEPPARGGLLVGFGAAIVANEGDLVDRMKRLATQLAQLAHF